MMPIKITLELRRSVILRNRMAVEQQEPTKSTTKNKRPITALFCTAHDQKCRNLSNHNPKSAKFVLGREKTVNFVAHQKFCVMAFYAGGRRKAKPDEKVPEAWSTQNIAQNRAEKVLAIWRCNESAEMPPTKFAELKFWFVGSSMPSTIPVELAK